jgi:putative ABC transport system substrate-binding protein
MESAGNHGIGVMKKSTINLLLLAALLTHGPAFAGREIVAVQSAHLQPYEQAFNGFQSVCSSRVTRLTLAESGDRNLARQIQRMGPDLVLAIGEDALKRVSSLQNIPVVYCMVLNPPAFPAGEKSVYGVSMSIPPERQLAALLDTLPDTTTIGFVYDPKRSGAVAARAREEAERMGLLLLAREVTDSREVPLRVLGMKRGIDVFWMLPDATVVTPETVEFLLLFSIQNKIPILTFSEKYVEMGAFLSVGIDAFDMGRQAGELAEAILSGDSRGLTGQVFARKNILSTNRLIAGKLGILVNVAKKIPAGSQEKIVRNVWPSP